MMSPQLTDLIDRFGGAEAVSATAARVGLSGPTRMLDSDGDPVHDVLGRR